MMVDEWYRAYPDMEEKIQRAWNIHGKFYEGETVTLTEQDEYDTLIAEIRTTDNLPFGILMWLIYAAKYIHKDKAVSTT